MESAAASAAEGASSGEGRRPGETSSATEGSFVRTRPQRSPFQDARGFSRRERRVGEEILAATSPAKVLEAATRTELSPVNCITAIHRIASLSGAAVLLGSGRALLLQAAKVAVEADARGIANFVWAIASMRLADFPVQGLLEAICCRIGEFGRQGIVNTLWSFAALQV